jgi:hypothetical protein
MVLFKNLQVLAKILVDVGIYPILRINYAIGIENIVMRET